MSTNISNICCKLVGISCLQGQVNERAREEWNLRFHEHDTFWVEASPEQTCTDLLQKIIHKITESGISSLASQTVVVAVFVDLTSGITETWLKEVISIPSELKNKLGCNVSIVMEFGYLGRLLEEDTQLLRQYAQMLIRTNQIASENKTQLCLVANSPLAKEGTDGWNAVVVLLDVLRRMPDPASFVPSGEESQTNNDVGFIRYGEYDELELQKLQETQREIADALGSEGEEKFKNLIQALLQEIEKEIEKKYQIDGACQPIHPGMIVDGWLNKRKASKGKNAEFNLARQATLEAIRKTGEGLKEHIKESYRSRIEKSHECLVSMMKKAGMGIELAADANLMESILTPRIKKESDPMLPALKYSENGYTTEITEYLIEVRKVAASKVKREIEAALLSSYQQLDKLKFAEEKEKLVKKMKNTQNLLDNLVSKQSLIKMVIEGSALPQTCFFPILGGGKSVTYLLCRTRQDEEKLDQECPGKVLYIDEKHGGLKKSDEAPVVALQLLMFDSSERRLADLIK